MERPSFNEQFNKITEAYIKGKIIPMNPNFCFCGTIGNTEWELCNSKHKQPYTLEEYEKMERALFTFLPVTYICIGTIRVHKENIFLNNKTVPEYEEKLFNGMCAALEVLKQIHIDSGEAIDDSPVFKKRELAV